jgi:hypothetical protein
MTLREELRHVALPLQATALLAVIYFCRRGSSAGFT